MKWKKCLALNVKHMIINLISCLLLFTTKKKIISYLVFLIIHLVLASTFKSVDSSSSTGDITRTKSKQKLQGLQVKATGSHYNCLKNKFPKDRHSSLPPRAPPARVYISSSVRWLAAGCIEVVGGLMWFVLLFNYLHPTSCSFAFPPLHLLTQPFCSLGLVP